MGGLRVLVNEQFQKNFDTIFRACLFGGKIEWMENFGEKMERKTFWSVFDWVGWKENK